MASFDGRSPTLSFSSSSGLSDGTTLIPTSHIISLIPPSAGDEYTLLHSSGLESPPGLRKVLLVAPPAALTSRYSLAELPPHLSPAVVDIRVIVSVGSGTGKALAYWDAVVRPLLAEYGLREDSYTVHVTTSADTIHEIAAAISAAAAAGKQKQQSVIILSGDTLLFELLNSLPPLPQKPIVSLLPLGTGNALSASLSKSSPPLSTLLLGTPRPLPGFEARFSPNAQFILPNSTGRKPLPAGAALRGCVVLSWGFHASLVADSDTAASRVAGSDRFKLAARANLLPDPHGYRGAVSILPVGGGCGAEEEEEAWVPLGDGGASTRHFYTLATMVSNLEETFCISPASAPLAGGLHVVYFPVLPPAEVMRIMGLAYQGGSHVRDPQVRYESVRGVRIEVGEEEERWRRVCVDGAIVAVPEGGWVEARIVESVVDVVFWEEGGLEL